MVHLLCCLFVTSRRPRRNKEIQTHSLPGLSSDFSALLEINIHPGKIVIYNPGSFPDDLTPYDFINRNLASYKRNKLILDVLFRSKDVEKSGTGFQRVDSVCRQNNVEWNFHKEAYGFYFEFIRTNVPINVPLSDDEEQIIAMLKENDSVTKANMATILGKSEKTVQRVLASLIGKGLIIREGSNRRGSWKVL